MGHARLGNHPASMGGGGVGWGGGKSARAPLPCDSLSPLPITGSLSEIDAPLPFQSAACVLAWKLLRDPRAVG